MKKLLLLLALLFACAGGDANDAVDPVDAGASTELGQSAAALTRPAGYGWRLSDTARCTALSGCALPATKHIYFKFFASTCPQWWQARAVEAEADWHNILEDLGWNVDYDDKPLDTVHLRCQDAGKTGTSDNVGRFRAAFFATAPDGHRPFSGGDIDWDRAQLEADSRWIAATDVQRQRGARNVLLHELMHSAGLGHVGAGGFLMTPGFSSSDLTTLYGTTTEENNMLADYVP